MTLAAITEFNTARIIVHIHADIFKPVRGRFVGNQLNRSVLLTNAQNTRNS
jgi:hypothetical protein